jgi:hypothetical protein
MKLLFSIAVLLIASLAAEAAGVTVIPASASSTVIATATTLVCNMQANAGKTAVNVACTKSGTVVGTTSLSLNAVSAVVAWSMSFGTTDVIAGTFTQAATLGAISYSVSVNGGAATTGSF